MRGNSRERSLRWLMRRENRRKYKRNPIAKELMENGPREQIIKDKQDRIKHKKSLYDWDVINDTTD